MKIISIYVCNVAEVLVYFLKYYLDIVRVKDIFENTKTCFKNDIFIKSKSTEIRLI